MLLLQRVFAKNVKRCRREKKWTQFDLAKHSGISISTIASIESARKINPSLETLERLAQALNVSPWKLIDLKLSQMGSFFKSEKKGEGNENEKKISKEKSSTQKKEVG